MRAKLWAGLCLASGGMLVVGPMALAGRAVGQPAGTGAAGVSVSLPSLSVTNPLGGSPAASLGTVSVGAESYPSLLAQVGLSGSSVLGRTVAGLGYSSAQGTRSGSAEVPVSAGPVSGSVDLLSYSVQSGQGTATAQLEGLSGKLAGLPLGLEADLGPQGLASRVTPSQSASGVHISSPGLTLTLGDLLPANVLEGLPLGVVLQLLGATDLPLSANLSGAVGALQGVAKDLPALAADLTSLAQAQATVTQLTSADPAIAAAEQKVASDQAAVTSAQSALDTARSTLSSAQTKLSTDQATEAADQAALTTACVVPASPTCTAAQAALNQISAAVTSDQSAVSSAQSALSSDQTTLSSAQTTLSSDQAALAALLSQAAAPGSALATAEGLVSSLTSTINGLLGTLQAQLGSLPSLQSLLARLTAALGDAPLLQVGNLSAVLSTAADARSGTSSVTCTLGSLAVLGQAVANPTCSSLQGLAAGIESKLASVLAVLPSAARPSVSLSGLQTTSSSTPAPGSSGATDATAGLSALHLAVAPISLSGVSDALSSQLESQLQQVASALGVSLASPALVEDHALSVPAQLSGLLTSLQAQLNTLPTGSALGGLSTLGLDAALAGVSAQSSFVGGQAASPGSPAPGATPATPGPTPPPGPATPAGGTLPFTGANVVGLMAAGLLLVVAGCQMLVGRRLVGARS